MQNVIILSFAIFLFHISFCCSESEMEPRKINEKKKKENNTVAAERNKRRNKNQKKKEKKKNKIKLFLTIEK